MCEKNSLVTEQKRFLLESIKNCENETQTMLSEAEIVSEKDFDDIDDVKCTSEWFKKLTNEAYADLIKEGDIENSLFCPDLIPNLERICKWFPLWSNLLNFSFNLPIDHNLTSASCENYFKFIKESLHTRLRADEFIQHHINLIEGSMKVSLPVVDKKESVLETERDNRGILEKEKWSKRKKVKHSYVQPKPSIIFEENSSNIFTLPTLKNGNIRNPVQCGDVKNFFKNYLRIRFDTVVHLLAFEMHHNSALKKLLTKEKVIF